MRQLRRARAGECWLASHRLGADAASLLVGWRAGPPAPGCVNGPICVGWLSLQGSAAAHAREWGAVGWLRCCVGPPAPPGLCRSLAVPFCPSG